MPNSQAQGLTDFLDRMEGLPSPSAPDRSMVGLEIPATTSALMYEWCANLSCRSPTWLSWSWAVRPFLWAYGHRPSIHYGI